MNDQKHGTSQVQQELKLMVLTGNQQEYENTLGGSSQHTGRITNINIIQQSYSMAFQITSYVILLLFMYATFITYFSLNFTPQTILSKQNK